MDLNTVMHKYTEEPISLPSMLAGLWSVTRTSKALYPGLAGAVFPESLHDLKTDYSISLHALQPTWKMKITRTVTLTQTKQMKKS